MNIQVNYINNDNITTWLRLTVPIKNQSITSLDYLYDVCIIAKKVERMELLPPSQYWLIMK